MSKNESDARQEPAGQPDHLSATGMFLRPSRAEAENPESPLPAGERDAGGNEASAPGEFTRLFRQAPPPAASAAPRANAPAPEGAEGGATNAPGDFTRIFGGDVKRPAPPPRAAEETAGPRVGAEAAPRAKGFSSPGASDSASGEGITQLFRAAPAGAQPRAEAVPAAPAPVGDPAREPNRSGERTSPAAEFRAPLPPASQEPPRSGSGLPQSPSGSFAEMSGGSGGVTQFIQKLADEPAAATPSEPAARPAVSGGAASSGPGEYTRMFTRPEERAAAAPAQTPAPAAAPPMPTMPAAPAIPAMKAPAIPRPVVPGPVPAAPVQVPKTRLEGMMPVLLLANTLLLVVVLLMLIYLLKVR